VEQIVPHILKLDGAVGILVVVLVLGIVALWRRDTSREAEVRAIIKQQIADDTQMTLVISNNTTSILRLIELVQMGNTTSQSFQDAMRDVATKSMSQLDKMATREDLQSWKSEIILRLPGKTGQ
jgi:hypothetical protein